MRQEHASKFDTRDDEAAAAHDRDFACLVSIVVPALSDSEQLQKLWRSIDVTGRNNFSCWSPHPSLLLKIKMMINTGLLW